MNDRVKQYSDKNQAFDLVSSGFANKTGHYSEQFSLTGNVLV